MRLARALLCVLAFSLLLAPVALASTYDVTTDHAVDVPDRTVQQGGETFQITSVSRADPGETVSVTTTAPRGEDVTLYLYNDREAIVATREGTGTARFEVTLDGYDAGTYAFVLQHDGVREAVHPLVVRGYSVDVDAPSSVTRGESLRVTATTEKLRGPDLASVEVVVANADTEVRTSAEPTGSDYAATVDTGDLPAGTYEVYANVRGPDRAFGERELLGLTTGESVTVESSDESAGGGGGGGPTSTVTPSPTATPTPTTTPTPTARPTTGGSAPAGRVTAPLADARPASPGVTVALGAPTLASITFLDGSVAGTGTVSVATHETPPGPFAAQFDREDVLTSVTVEPPAAASGTRARLQFGLPASALGDREPASLVVVRAVDGGVRLLPTEVNASGSTVAVSAGTAGGTQFAVVSVARLDVDATATPTETGTATPGTATERTPTAGDGSTHVASAAALATLLVLLVLRRRG